MLVTVLRAFIFNGERQEPGGLVEMDDAFGREMLAVGKVERVGAEEPPSGPMTTDTVASLVSGRKRGRNAR